MTTEAILRVTHVSSLPWVPYDLFVQYCFLLTSRTDGKYTCMPDIHIHIHVCTYCDIPLEIRASSSTVTESFILTIYMYMYLALCNEASYLDFVSCKINGSLLFHDHYMYQSDELRPNLMYIGHSALSFAISTGCGKNFIASPLLNLA